MLKSSMFKIQAKKVFAGDNNSFFVDIKNSVYACGRNDYGQLGDGTCKSSNTLVKVKNLQGKNVIKIVSVNNYSVFLCEDAKSGRTVFTCGGYSKRKAFEQHGCNVCTKEPRLYEVAGGASIIDLIDASNKIYIQIEMGNSRRWLVFCSANSTFRLIETQSGGRRGFAGSRQRTLSRMFNTPINMNTVQQNNAFKIYDDGTVKAKGKNTDCCLGVGRKGMIKMFSKVQNLDGRKVSEIVSGVSHTYFLCKNGRIYGCGNNEFGQLGCVSNCRNILSPQLLQTIYLGHQKDDDECDRLGWLQENQEDSFEVKCCGEKKLELPKGFLLL